MTVPLAHKIIKRFDSLLARRVNWDAHWDEIAQYILLNDRFRVFGNVIPGGGEKKFNTLFDATGVHSNELLASALHSMLTNPTSFWFGMETGIPEIDNDDEVRDWFQRAALRMHLVLNNSNFQTEVHEVYLDLGGYGTGVMRIEPDDKKIVRFHARPVWETYIAEDSRGIVDTVYRKFKWTLRQIAQEFGEKALPLALQQQLSKPEKMEEEFEVIHAVFPREGFNNDSVPKNFQFASIYLLREKQHILLESGYKTMPYVTPRWTKISGEEYGRSPGMKALADIKMLNEIMRVSIQAAQLTIRPPMLAPDDGVFFPLDMTPGAVTSYRSGMQDEIRPLITNTRVDIGFDVMSDIRQRIRSAFFIDQLQLQEGPQMTATEVMQRTEEKLRLLGPILGRQNFEFLQPTLDRVFDIMMEAGEIPLPIPQALQGRDVRFHYTSQIVKAQRTSELENLNRAIATAAPIIQVDPSAMDNVDPDGTIRYIFKLLGLPSEVLRPEQIRDDIRSQRQQQQQELLEQQQEMAQAEQIQKAGPTLLKASGQG